MPFYLARLCLAAYVARDRAYALRHTARETFDRTSLHGASIAKRYAAHTGYRCAIRRLFRLSISVDILWNFSIILLHL